MSTRRKQFDKYCREAGIAHNDFGVFISYFQSKYAVVGNENKYRFIELFSDGIGHREMNRVLKPNRANIFDNLYLFVRQVLFGDVEYTFWTDNYCGTVLKNRVYLPPDIELPIIENESLAFARRHVSALRQYDEISFGWYITKFEFGK